MEPDDRDASEIRAFARRFGSVLPAGAFEEEEGPSIGVLPGSSGLRGVGPVVEQRINANDEAQAAAAWLVDRHRAGFAWRDLVVLAPGKRNWREPIAKALARLDIPHRMLLGDKSIEPDLAGDHVHVMTLHAVEGLAFPAVAILGIGDLPWKQQTLEEAARLLHVAMTRATHALMISHSKPSTLVERLLSI